MIVAMRPKLQNYKTHLLSHECNETLDQTGAELENLGHSVQVLLVTVRLLLQYHSIEIDIHISEKTKVPLQGPRPHIRNLQITQ